MGDEKRREEFEKTALPFAGPLYGMAVRLTGRPEDALDVVQETFLRAYRTFHNFRTGTNPKAWLFTILRSISANRHRRNHRQPRLVAMDDLDERFSTAMTAPAPSEPGADEIERAIGSLPEEFRLAVVLVDIEGLTYEEAAVAMDCPVGTVRSRLSRGRRALFVALRDYAAKVGYGRGDT